VVLVVGRGVEMEVVEDEAIVELHDSLRGNNEICISDTRTDILFNGSGYRDID
jgi:hypothetical protein